MKVPDKKKTKNNLTMKIPKKQKKQSLKRNKKKMIVKFIKYNCISNMHESISIN